MNNLKYSEKNSFEFHESVIGKKQNTKDDPNYKNRVATYNKTI